jgi:hypothetical protein
LYFRISLAANISSAVIFLKNTFSGPLLSILKIFLLILYLIAPFLQFSHISLCFLFFWIKQLGIFVCFPAFCFLFLNNFDDLLIWYKLSHGNFPIFYFDFSLLNLQFSVIFIDISPFLFRFLSFFITTDYSIRVDIK